MTSGSPRSTITASSAQGACEIVYAEGKTPEEVRAIVERLLSGNEGPILVLADLAASTSTRSAPPPQASPVEIVERPRARCVALRRNVLPRRARC